MKKLVILCLVMATSAASMIAQETELFTAKLKKEAIPATVIESIAEDFPEVTITEYAAVPITVIDDAVYVRTNQEAMGRDYDTYLITMTGKNGQFRVSYDKTGKLLSSVEVLKDVALPVPIRTSIGRHFPGWAVVGDKEVMTTIKDGKQRSHYKVILEKDKEKHYVVFDGDGNIVRGAEKARAHRQIDLQEHKMKRWDKGEYKDSDTDKK